MLLLLLQLLPGGAHKLTCVCIQRGDFVPRHPASTRKTCQPDLAAQPGVTTMQSRSATAHSDAAGQPSKWAEHADDAGQPSSRSEQSGGVESSDDSGQGSFHQASSSWVSHSSHDTEQSGSGIGRFSTRPGQSPAALHLRESISGLLTSQEPPTQASGSSHESNAGRCSAPSLIVLTSVNDLVNSFVSGLI